MANAEELIDAEFTSQLQGLFQQAERELGVTSEKAAAAKNSADSREPIEIADMMEIKEAKEAKDSKEAPPRKPEPREVREIRDTPDPVSPLPGMLRPLIQGIEAVSRATGENTLILRRIETASQTDGEAAKTLPKVVADFKSLLEQRNAVSQKMFDALHQELSGYKDSFLLETLHRPIIRDLISLFDDLSEIRNQLFEVVGSAASAASVPNTAGALDARLKQIHTNLEHKIEFVMEVLNRLEVTMMPLGDGKLDRQRQRAVFVRPTDDAERDLMIVQTLKRGFLWQDRVVRAEEVVIEKCSEGDSSRT